MEYNFSNINSVLGDRILIPWVNIDNAEDVLRDSLEYFCGTDFKWLDAYGKVVDWMKDNHNKGLLLMGPNGTGKTTIADKILRNVLNDYWSKVFRKDAPVMGSFNAYTLKAADEYNYNKFIDDIGSETLDVSYGKVTDLFSKIVYDAEKMGLMLICTSNLTPDELKQKYGMRTWDRIRSMMYQVTIKGDSLRKDANEH